MCSTLHLLHGDRYRPTTNPATVCGGPEIFIDSQVVMTLPTNAAQSGQLVDCAVCSLVGGGVFLMTPLSHADQSWQLVECAEAIVES